jgi:hypothetical protein
MFVPFFFHWYVGVVPPLMGVVVKVTDVPAQIAPDGEAAMLTLAATTGLTDIVIAFDIAGLPDTQVAFEVISTVIASPFTSVVDVHVEFVAPEILLPFLLHWYVGVVPPFVGVAVKVTEVPEQTVVAVAAIDTLTARFGFTVSVAALVIALLPPLQFVT